MLRLQTDIASEEQQIKELMVLKKQLHKEQHVLDKNFMHAHEGKELELIAETQELMAQIDLTQIKIRTITDERAKVQAMSQFNERQRKELRGKEEKLVEIAK